jgi:hypothetical protein
MRILFPTIFSGSGYFSGSFDGDGSRLNGILTSSIVDFNQNIKKITFPYIGKAQITGSLVINGFTSSSADFFLVKSGSFNPVKVNDKGVLQLGSFATKPSASEGGIIYSDSSYWIGLN